MALRRRKKKVKRLITHDNATRPDFLTHFRVFGIIGWSLLIPVLLGIAGGIWLEKTFKDVFPWSAILILVSLSVGVLNAWFWIVQNKKLEKK